MEENKNLPLKNFIWGLLFSLYAKFSKKLTFIVPWSTQLCAMALYIHFNEIEIFLDCCVLVLQPLYIVQQMSQLWSNMLLFFNTDLQ